MKLATAFITFQFSLPRRLPRLRIEGDGALKLSFLEWRQFVHCQEVLRQLVAALNMLLLSTGISNDSSA